MPRVVSFRIGVLYVAFTLNDYGYAGPRRWSFSELRARTKAVVAE